MSISEKTSRYINKGGGQAYTHVVDHLCGQPSYTEPDVHAKNLVALLSFQQYPGHPVLKFKNKSYDKKLSKLT